MFHTGSNREIEFQHIPDAIKEYYERHKDICDEISIIIGTDSQNFSDTKVVSVICVIAAGKGGIFFYEVTHTPVIRDVRRKLYMETNGSLELATKLVDALESDSKYREVYENCPISIHVDAGNSERGKTRSLIPELVGWIKGLGFDVKVKPASIAASCVADKISK